MASLSSPYSTLGVIQISSPTQVALAEIYAEVSQFHARQLQLLDAGLHDDAALRSWAETLAVDAEHWVNSRPAPTHGREAILTAQQANPIWLELKRRDLMRRHLISNLVVEVGTDDTVHSAYYVQVVDTARGGPVTVGSPTLVRETLTREGGELRTLRRKVERDDLR